MEKVKLDWKAPSEKKMMDLVRELTPQDMKEFATDCSVSKDGKRVVDKTKAKKWIRAKFEGKDRIEWKNLPTGGRKQPTISETLEEWLKL